MKNKDMGAGWGVDLVVLQSEIPWLSDASHINLGNVYFIQIGAVISFTFYCLHFDLFHYHLFWWCFIASDKPEMTPLLQITERQGQSFAITPGFHYWVLNCQAHIHRNYLPENLFSLLVLSVSINKTNLMNHPIISFWIHFQVNLWQMASCKE